MTQGVVDVKDLTLFVDVTGGAGTKVAIGCATDAQLEVSSDLREILCKDTGGGVDYKPSTIRWTGSASGLFAFDAVLGGVDFLDLIIAGTKLVIRFGTDESGDSYWEGDALISSVPISSSGGAGENVTYSVSFQGIGVPVKGFNA